MNKFKKIITDWQNIFIFISIIFISFMVIYYGSRLVHYYKLEHPDVVNNGDVLLSDIIKSKEVIESPGLIKEENNYVYKGLVENNYIEYSGILFRIVKVNSDNSVVLITEDNQTMLTFNDSYSWLNSSDSLYQSFYKNLTNADYLVNTNICVSIFDEIDNITCDEVTSENKIDQLSLYDYINAGANESYLNNESYFYTSTVNNEEYYYVFDLGGVNSKLLTDEQNYGVRPLITLKSDVLYLSGDGTINNPYIIEINTKETLKDTSTGDYVMYSNQLFEVIGTTDLSKKLVLIDNIKEQEEDLLISFDSTSSTFTNTTNIYKYLNETYYNSLENKDYIISSSFYNGIYTKETSYDINSVYQSSVEANVGLLTIGDFYISEITNTFLMQSGKSLVYAIKDYKLYGDSKTSSYGVRPVINLDNTLKITGQGTFNNPYELSR